MVKSPDQQSISEIFETTRTLLGPVFSQLDWAESEIAAATARHRGQRDLLYHSFALLTPTQESMSTEFVYRSHANELLARVVSGEDTRPATAAEVCCACSAASLIAPLRPAAAGLYARMWVAAFPDQPNFFHDAAAHHEAFDGETITDLERYARHKLAVSDRRLGDIDCAGLHHGRRVRCRYTFTGSATTRTIRTAS